MIRILGIDPGSLVTGYGVVDSDGNRHRYCASGSIRVPALDFPARLKVIFESLGEVLDHWSPTEVAVEQVFVNRNPGSALKLGQARGAAICAAVTRQLPVAEYTPRAVKLAVVGTGGADKQQVQHMVKVLLSLDVTPSFDAADALGVALCHGHTRLGLSRLGQAAVAGHRRAL